MLPQGQFPSSNKKTLAESKWHSLGILGRRDVEEFDLFAVGGIAPLANISWAVTLRSYVRSNFISFRLLLSGESADGSVLCYRLSDHERLDKIYAVDLKELDGVQLGHANINTAVDHTWKATSDNEDSITWQKWKHARGLEKV